MRRVLLARALLSALAAIVSSPLLGADAAPPHDWLRACSKATGATRHSLACERVEPATTPLSGAVRDAAWRINREVNWRRGAGRPDRPGEGWGTGSDCEDFALEKRALLIAAGLPAGAVRIGWGWARRGRAHAWVVIQGDNGALHLDNLYDGLRSHTPHREEKRCVWLYGCERVKDGDL